MTLTENLNDRLSMRPARQAKELPGHQGRVVRVAFAPDGRSVLSGGEDHVVRLWDLASGFEIRAFPLFQGMVGAVGFSPSGTIALACGLHRKGKKKEPPVTAVVAWDVESGRELRHFELPGRFTDLSFAGGRLLLVGEEQLLLWDLENDEPVKHLSLGLGSFQANASFHVAIAPGERQVFLTCKGSSRSWLIDLEQGRLVREFSGPRGGWRIWSEFPPACASISLDGRHALTGDLDQAARVWDVRTGKPLVCFRGHQRFWGQGGMVGGVLLPDGKRAVSAGKDGTLRLWDASTGRELHRDDLSFRPSCLACRPDGKFVVVGGTQGEMEVWEVAGK